MGNVIVQLFDNPQLNRVASDLINLDKEYVEHMKQARQSIYSAFHTRWLYGKIIYENYDLIIDECGTQKEFAERIGQSEGVVSNNKRAYKYLLDEGCESWNEVVETLENKEIKPTVYNFERIGRLLNEPRKDTVFKEQISKDRKRLEELRGEAEDILRRNEPGANPDFLEDAFEFIEDIEEIMEFLDSFRPERSDWKSEKYLNHIRNFGYDLITGEPCERCDPHHTKPDGSTGPTNKKLADFYAIPVSRDTHNRIGSGEIEPTPREILEAQFICLSSFLTLNMK